MPEASFLFLTFSLCDHLSFKLASQPIVFCCEGFKRSLLESPSQMTSATTPDTPLPMTDIENQTSVDDVYNVLTVSQKKWILMTVAMVALITPFTDTVNESSHHRRSESIMISSFRSISQLWFLFNRICMRLLIQSLRLCLLISEQWV